MMKKHFEKIKLYQYFGLVLLLCLMPIKALAYDVDFYSSNDILFYTPSDDCSTVDLSSDVVNIQKSDTLQQIFQLLNNSGMNAGQVAAIMGNMYADSNFNSDKHEDGNDLGYGLAQWSLERRTNLENFATTKSVPNSDIPMQIEFLLNEYNNTYKTNLDNTAFKDGTNIASSTKAWMEIFESQLLASPANDPAALNSKRIPAAQRVYSLYSGTTTSSMSTTNGCNSSGNGIVAGNIAKTAINLALSEPVADGKDQKADARDTYQTAKELYNPTVSWSDCGGFVATVMISSGVDPNYTKVSVSSQYDYVKSHPEKYLVIDNPSVQDLQTGDILIASSSTFGHTIIYTNGSNYPDVEASLDHTVPSAQTAASHVRMLSNGAIIARLIK